MNENINTVVPAKSAEEAAARIEQLEQSGFDLASYGDQAEQVGQDELLDEMTDAELAALVEKPVQVELSLESIVDQLIEASKKNEFTMYGIATVLNQVLETIGATKEGKDYRVRPQMVYNYNRNNMLAKDEKGKGRKLGEFASKAELRAFVLKFAAKFI